MIQLICSLAWPCDIICLEGFFVASYLSLSPTESWLLFVGLSLLNLIHVVLTPIFSGTFYASICGVSEGLYLFSACWCPVYIYLWWDYIAHLLSFVFKIWLRSVSLKVNNIKNLPQWNVSAPLSWPLHRVFINLNDGLSRRHVLLTVSIVCIILVL